MAYLGIGDQILAQRRAQREREEAINSYNAQKAALDQKYENKGLGGFLGDIVGGIGKTIGDVGKGVGGLFGTAGASIGDLVNSVKDGKVTDEGTRAFKRYWYGGEDDADAAAKAAGTSLNAATTLASTVLPAAGAGTAIGKVAAGTAANTAAGALGGVADEFQQQGKNASFEGATNRALSGAAAGLATGGLNRKLGNATSKVGSTLLNNKLATSAVGRGALSGAVGGSVGAGTSAALAGQDVASAALQGGLTGAAGGAAQGAILSGANKAGNSIAGKMIDNKKQRIVSSPTGVATTLDALDEATSPTLRGGVNQSIENINTVRKNQAESATIGKLPVDYMEGSNTNPRIDYIAEIANKKLANPSGNHIVSPSELAYSTNNYTRSKILEFAGDNNQTKLNIVRPVSDDKYLIVGLNKQPDGNLLVTNFKDSASRSYIKNLQKNKNASVLYDTAGGSFPTTTDESASFGSWTTVPEKSVSQNTKNVNPNLMYGESELGNRTKRGIAADAISRLGNTLEGAQTNITRAAARDLGIESTGKVVDNVRRKTGIVNLETQANLAKELTGGENSLMDRVQRQALTATEDGRPFRVDTSNVVKDVNAIVSKYADSNTFGSEKAKNTFIDNLKRDIKNDSTDVLSIANRMKGSAADLRGKGIVGAKPSDAAKAKIYTEVANRLDDLSYSAIPQENVEAMFDATIGEMKGRAQQAQANGNTDIAKAYNTLADALDTEPRTVKAYRSFKKDFVDVSKINELTGQAENGAAFQMGSSLAGGLKRGVNTMLQRPVNAGLAKVGGAVNNLADVVDTGPKLPTGGNGVQEANLPARTSQPMSQDMLNILGNYIGRTTGLQKADNNVTNLQKAQEYQNLEDMFSGIMSDPTYDSALTGGGINSGYGMSSGYGAQSGAMGQLTSQLNEIAGAMSNALAAGDMSAYSQLADMYSTAYKIYQSQAELSGLGSSNSSSNLSTAEKNQLAKLQSASTAIDELESLYNKAGGGQGVIGGNVANFLGGLGLNSDVSTYNQLAQGLINQIGAAIGKTDSLNTEGEVQRALSLVPKLTDDAQTAKNKLATLRSLLQTNTGTYNQLYGA